MEARFEGILNIKIVGNSIRFLKRVKIQNFDAWRRKHEALNLEGFSRWDFELEPIVKFLLGFKVRFFM
jgi:hypothetical protein